MGVMSKVQMQFTMEATHFLESQGQVSLAGSKSSSPWKSLTNWRTKLSAEPNPAHHQSHSLSKEPKTCVISRVQIQLATKAAHYLESQGPLLSAGSKSNSPLKPLTVWRAKESCHQQGPNTSHYQSHSQAAEPGT